MEQVKNLIGELLKTNPNDVIIHERLKLGMSNILYHFSLINDHYTIRLPGDHHELFVNRKNEYDAVKLIETEDINTKTRYFDLESGIKISKYVEGRVLANEFKDDDIIEVNKILKKLHQVNAQNFPLFDPFNKLKYFQSLFEVNDSLYLEVLSNFMKYKEYLSSNQNLVFSHNDAQLSNLIYGNDGKMYLVDYEFAGLNDEIYDIACFGIYDYNLGLKLLKLYLNREPNEVELNKYFLWRTYQGLQWYCVATVKHNLKLDTSLAYNFLDVAKMFLDLAKKSMEYVK